MDCTGALLRSSWLPSCSAHLVLWGSRKTRRMKKLRATERWCYFQRTRRISRRALRRRSRTRVRRRIRQWWELEAWRRTSELPSPTNERAKINLQISWSLIFSARCERWVHGEEVRPRRRCEQLFFLTFLLFLYSFWNTFFTCGFFSPSFQSLTAHD